MIESFLIRHVDGRTLAAIDGLPPGGQKTATPFIIPVFLPMSGCPHRCTFCNQTAITGIRSRTPERSLVEEALKTFLPLKRHPSRPVQIAFYGGNFLGLPAPAVHELLEAAAVPITRGDVASIRFSTRPDTISSHTLATVGDFPVETIELGVQSLNDRVLELTRRGHDAARTVQAARMVKAAGYRLGLQMMTGLPGDTPAGTLQTAEGIMALAPDFVRIYPTLVLKNSPLAGQFRHGAFTPATMEATIELVSRLFLKFTAAGIRVIRMGLQADDALSSAGTILAGPYHPALGEQVYSRIFYHLAEAAIALHPNGTGAPVIEVHPRHLSRMIGTGRANITRLKARFQIETLSVQANPAMAPHHLEVDNAPSPIASRLR